MKLIIFSKSNGSETEIQCVTSDTKAFGDIQQKFLLAGYLLIYLVAFGFLYNQQLHAAGFGMGFFILVHELLQRRIPRQVSVLQLRKQFNS